MSNLILPRSAQRHQAERREAERRARIDGFVAVAKSFMGPGGAPPSAMGAVGQQPGSPMKAGWTSNLGNAALLARATQTYSQQHDVPAAELEQALLDQGLSWGQPFAPGRPLEPFAGYRAPARTRSYQVGENVQVTPRHGRVSFETLKALYGAWDVPQLCCQHLINDVRSLDISWLPADGVKTDVSADIEAAEAFFLVPDRRRPFRAWLAMWLQDTFRWDAGTLYIRRNNAGDPIALETVDGTTIIPLADYYGRIPMDEDDDSAAPGEELDGDVVPAYQQVIQGMPWDWLTAEDLIYQPLNPVPESQYGLAPLEKILLTGNTDVRFQMHFLEYFTDSSLPAGLMEAPPDMSDPAQLQEWQDVWDALMVGDQAMLRKIRWVPSGTKFNAVKNSDFDEKFPLYLMRRCCAAYGVTPSDIGFTDQVNKATGDTQIDVQFRVGTRPALRHVEDILSLFAQRDLGLKVKLQIDDGREVEDRVATAQAHSIYIQAGVESPDEVRDEIGKPTDKTQAVSRFVQTRTGIVPLEALLGQTKNPVDPETFAPAGKVEYVPAVAPPAPVAPIATPAAGSEPAAGAGEQAQASDATPAGQKPAIPGGSDAANTNTSPVAKADVEIGKRSGMVSLDLPKGLLPIHEDGIDDHHITVVFLGQNVTDDLFEQVCDRAAQVAADTPPLQGSIGGLGTFAPGEDGTPVYAVPDMPGLDELRGAFEDFNASEHTEFHPHVTLTYHQPGDPMPEPTPQTPVTFGALSVHRGEDCQSFPFTGAAASKALTAGITAQTGIQGVDLIGRQPDDEDEDDQDDEDDEIRKALIDVSLRRWKANARNRLRKGQAPRRFTDPNLPAGLHDAVWAKLQHASSRGEVDAAFAEIPKARARKAGAPTLADFHRQTDQIVEHYAPLIAEQLAGLWSEETIHKAFDAAAGVKKAVADPPGGPPSADTPAGAAVQVLSGDLAASADALQKVLAELYGDAALQGAHEAAHAAGGTIVSSLQGVTAALPETYWDTWEPGWGEAAVKDADGGLKELLDQSDVTIKGLADSAIDRIGNALADGLAAGDSFQSTAKAVQEVVASPARAALIANTEMGRAMSAASMDTYEASGVEQCDWLAEGSACEECAGNAEGSPYALDDAPSQPAHPGCRCAVAPHV